MSMKSNPQNTYPDYWNSYEKSFEKGFPDTIAQTNFVVLDTETTGFDFKRDRILSIGALRIKNATIHPKAAFEVFVKQEIFASQTVEIHGILQQERTQQLPEVEALKILLKLLEKAVLVAHHTAFDVGMLNHALHRNGLPKLKNPTLDTAILYNKSLKRSEQKKEGHYTLDELAEKYNIPQTDRHTALGDAYITAIAFLHILNVLRPVSLKQLLKKDRPWEFWKPF